jgi:hypothetical protein
MVMPPRVSRGNCSWLRFSPGLAPQQTSVRLVVAALLSAFLVKEKIPLVKND